MVAPQPTPSPDWIRDKALEIVSRPEYRLEDSAYDSQALEILMRWLRSILKPLAGLFDTLAAISPVLAWAVFIVCSVILVLLTWHIVHTFRSAMRRKTSAGDYVLEQSRARRDPSTWEDMAAQAAGRAEFIDAVRYLFRAALLRLDLARDRVTPAGLTNREHLHRYHDTLSYPALQLFVETIDAKWYGMGACSATNFSDCEQAYTAICASVREDDRAQAV